MLARRALRKAAVRVLEEHAQLVAVRAHDVAAAVAVDVAHRQARVIEVDLRLALGDERARAAAAGSSWRARRRRGARASRPTARAPSVVPRPGTSRRGSPASPSRAICSRSTPRSSATTAIVGSGPTARSRNAGARPTSESSVSRSRRSRISSAPGCAVELGEIVGGGAARQRRAPVGGVGKRAVGLLVEDVDRAPLAGRHALDADAEQIAAPIAVEIDEVGLHDAAAERDRLDRERILARPRGTASAALIAAAARTPRIARIALIAVPPASVRRPRRSRASARAPGRGAPARPAPRTRAAAGRPARR